MAADAALKVVKQIQGLADGPKTQEMRECLGHMTYSLQFFLDHPDSRVRLSSAKAMSRLCKSYAEDFKKLDLTKAKSAHSRCTSAVDSGNAEHDVVELQALLADILQTVGADVAAPAAMIAAPAVAAVPSSENSPAIPERAVSEERGEVVLKIGETCENRAAILEAVVKVPGVVSVTLEDIYVVVNTKTPQVVKDSDFLFDLLGAVKAQANGQKVEVVTHPTAVSSLAADAEPVLVADDEDDGGEPQYLDDDEDDEVVFSGDGPSAGVAFGAPAFGGGFGRGVAPGGQQWSFFAQSNWMTGRRVQEFQDDPAIVARLAKARQKEEELKQEEQSRLSKLTSWFGRR